MWVEQSSLKKSSQFSKNPDSVQRVKKKIDWKKMQLEKKDQMGKPFCVQDVKH